MDTPARLITLRRLPATLAASCRIPPECRTHLEALVRLRAAAFARVLVPLTLAWIPLDLVALGAASALSRKAGRLPRFTAMWLLVGLQAAGFGLLQWLVPPRDDALRIGYGLFPYLMAAQLALFPLPWWRNLLAALVAASQLALLLELEGGTADAALWNRVWLFGLIVAVGAWNGQTQLRLLVRLLAARRDAAHDPLTGLANRRHAAVRLEVACADADRRNEPLSVLMLDLDHFKRVNDRHGHAGGDGVLVALAQALQRELRASDLAARLGGEEFLAVLPACDEVDALATAERIRLAVAAMHVPVPDGEARVTLSVGLATRHPGEVPEALIARADAALYRAKARGRNRCEVG